MKKSKIKITKSLAIKRMTELMFLRDLMKKNKVTTLCQVEKLMLETQLIYTELENGNN